MKVKLKDEIIKCLIDILSTDDGTDSRVPHDTNDYYIEKGWIESLMWTLGLTEEEKNVFKYSKEAIISAVDIAIGDDGMRSKEVIAILESE